MALKGGMRRKAGQATNLLDKAATTEVPLDASLKSDFQNMNLDSGDSDALHIYAGDARQTDVSEQSSTSIMKKGGATASKSESKSATSTFEYEKFNEISTGE